MIEPKTETVELFSRLGKVGSIQAFDPWESRKSVAHAKAWVARVASLSYGNTEAANPEKLFQRIVDLGHLSCLEFVPVGSLLDHLPKSSLRYVGTAALRDPDFHLYKSEERMAPASAFLVSCPLYTRSQWMRHRSFSYLEMSRRYTKGSKVAWSYYGDTVQVSDSGATIRTFPGPIPDDGNRLPESVEFHKACEAEYQRRLDAGWSNEIARGCMPMEAMTSFWVAGFDRDWREFVRLRSDAHAQPEIRVYSDWIRDYLDSKESNA